MDKTFEEIMFDLESIVKELENDSLPLEVALEKYKQGIELSKMCHDRLSKAKDVIAKKIEG